MALFRRASRRSLKEDRMKLQNVGLIGLAVMGQNLVLNMWKE